MQGAPLHEKERVSVSFALWRDPRGYFSVCNGPGPGNVVRYIFQRPNNSWGIENDALDRAFLDAPTAASATLRKELPEGVRYYELTREGETAFVATYPDVLARVVAEGWAVAAERDQL